MQPSHPLQNRRSSSTTASRDARSRAARSRAAHIGERATRLLLAALRWLMILAVVLVTAMIVLIPLRWGPTPIGAALLLLAGWLGLLVALIATTRRRLPGLALGATLGLLLLGAGAVVISQRAAYTPPITDAQGRPIPGSIAVLEQVELNGSRQWISIRGASVDKPVLLFLAGGPGGSQLATERHTLGALELQFVVVNWEQPGAGKSFDAVPRATLTPERYIADGRALVELLRRRFDEDKVYVLGESWGSALGIMLVQRYPELFHAFIGTGQMVAFTETDQLDYDFALRWARERGDTAKVARLTRQGAPPYYDGNVALKQIAYLSDTYAYMNQNPAIYAGADNTFRDLLSPEYGLYDKVSWVRGLLDTLNIVYPQLWSVDFRTQAPRLEVPVFFLIGRHDINAPVALTQQYFDLLEAPAKELVWFEHSGHTPWTREPDRFVAAIVERVLPATTIRP